MGPDASNLAASVSRATEVDRSPHATQRASDLAQERLSGESIAALRMQKASALDHLQREKIRHDRERRRREMERRAAHPDKNTADAEPSGDGLDFVA